MNVYINLFVFMIFIFIFMKYMKDWKVDKCVINILFGVGKNFYFGWGVYCIMKVGVNMFI